MADGITAPDTIGVSDDALALTIDVDAAGLARISRLAAAAAGPAPSGGPVRAAGASPAAAPYAGLPLIDVVLAGEGRAWSGHRYCESVAGSRLRYAGHEHDDTATDAGTPSGRWRQLRVDLADPVTGLRAEVFYRVLTGAGALRSWVRLINHGTSPVTVESVTSLLCGGLSGAGDGAPEDLAAPDDLAAPHDLAAPDDLAALDVLWAENDWLAEGRWQRRALRDALPDLNRRAHGADPRGMFGVTSTGTWSSGSYLPMGGVTNRRTGHTWIWQIEHNGAWHWQAGEHARGGAYLALLGPADNEHHWRITLAPGEAFTTVPVAMAVSADGFDGALARLTAYRRAIRRPHDDHQRLPVIFNDYMNTLMADPTTERLRPLIAAAAAAGAEYFCIDAGWYAELGQGWWDTVGAWKPSPSRFPNGITEVLDRIRAAGMVPGLWLEPEVVGVRSPVVDRLPADAFFTRGGQRVVEHGRYHLDLRHPAAIKHLDETIDFLVGDLSVGYLKLDYNINGGPGTDVGAGSAGAGLLAHNRAHLNWLDAVLDRHPALVIENCASGGMRADYAMLARLQLQSTSDQQDFLRYAAIAAAAPAMVTPEQAAVWAYPQPDFSDSEIAFTLCSALLGRVHLSGHLDQMSAAQQRLVAGALRVYKRIRPDLAQAVPFWPLGLPRWPDSWLAVGMRAPAASYVVAWHRGAPAGPAGITGPADPTGITLPVPHLRGKAVEARTLYPGDPAGPATVSWDAGRGELAVALPACPAACLIRLG